MQGRRRDTLGKGAAHLHFDSEAAADLVRVSGLGVDGIGNQTGTETMNLDLQPETPVATERDQGHRIHDSGSAPPAWTGSCSGRAVAVFVACCMGPYYFTLLRPPADRVNDLFQEWASVAQRLGRSSHLHRSLGDTSSLPRPGSIASKIWLDLDRGECSSADLGLTGASVGISLLPGCCPGLEPRFARNVRGEPGRGLEGLSNFLLLRSLFRLLAALLVCGPIIMQFYHAQLNMEFSCSLQESGPPIGRKSLCRRGRCLG